MTLVDTLLNAAIKGFVNSLCRVDAEQLKKFPAQGPLIAVANHINFLEVPVMYSQVYPRPVTGFAKAESWDNPFLAWLFNRWDIIPVRRGEADMDAMRSALEVLRKGRILAVTPEGTRSGHGCLQQGQPGVVILAVRSGAPLLPVVYYGGEKFNHNLRHLRRTDFHVVVGQPFYLDAAGARVTRAMRQQMVDEIMYQIAALLPPPYRGHYADLSAATESYLRFSGTI